MKTNSTPRYLTFLLLLLASWAGVSPLRAQPFEEGTPPTGFNYEGRLFFKGVPANGDFTLRYGLHTSPDAEPLVLDPQDRGRWAEEMTYNRGDVVTSGGGLWLAKRANTASTPVAGAAGPWLDLGPSAKSTFAFRDAWTAGTRYDFGSVVTHQGALWIYVGGTPGAAEPPGVPPVWRIIPAGTQAGNFITSKVTVTDGSFVAPLQDFGPEGFTGLARWLNVEVATLDDAGKIVSYTTLTPRQEIGVVPYALYAFNASTRARWRGPFTSRTDYAIGDAVSQAGTVWISKAEQPAGVFLRSSWDEVSDSRARDANVVPYALHALDGVAGPAGPQGPVGPQGAAGVQGPKGDKGDTGANGAAGAAGLQGVAGPAGAVGAKGDKGDPGLTGAAGATGATGPQGIPGLIGPQGPIGPIGLTGATGAAGATGPAGPAGAKGVNWRGTWAAGTAYAIGDAVANGGASWFAKAASTGVTPVAGASWDLLADKGAAGTTGPAGATGATGAPGATGLQGVPGVAGPAGAQGPVGPIGATGATGPAGATGAVGPAGPAGAKGVNWRGAWAAGTAYAIGDAVANGGASWFAKAASTGVTPVAGAAWDLLADKGATGTTGPAGATGATGAAGPQGSQGPAGATGPQGPAGTVPANVAKLDVPNAFMGNQTVVNGNLQLTSGNLTMQSGSFNLMGGNLNVAGNIKGNGIELFNLQAESLAQGTLNDLRLSENVARRNVPNTFTGDQTVAGTVTATSFAGSGGGLSGVNAVFANFAGAAFTLRVPEGAGNTDVDSDKFARRDVGNTFTGNQTINSGSLNVPNGPVALGGALAVGGTVTAGGFAGNGSGLTGVNAATAVTAASFTGSVTDSQLSANVPRLDAANTFTGAFGVSSPGGGLLSIVDEGFTPALVMTGGGAPGILRVRNALEVWPNAGGTAAGAIDVRDAGGAATIALSGANGTVTAASFAGSGSALTGVAKLAGGNTFAGDTRINGKLNLNNGGTLNGTLALQAAPGDDFPLLVSDQNGTTLLQVSASSPYVLQVIGNAAKTQGGDTWVVASDERLKQHIRPYEHGLDAILQLRTKRFEYIDDPAHHTTSGHEEIGLIAQQVEGIIPEAVSQGPDGYRTLNASPIHWAAINAMQELNGKVEAQSAELTALQAQNRSLEQRLAALENLIGRLGVAKGGE